VEDISCDFPYLLTYFFFHIWQCIQKTFFFKAKFMEGVPRQQQKTLKVEIRLSYHHNNQSFLSKVLIDIILRRLIIKGILHNQALV
jgi:hypothetical protein